MTTYLRVKEEGGFLFVYPEQVSWGGSRWRVGIVLLDWSVDQLNQTFPTAAAAQEEARRWRAEHERCESWPILIEVEDPA